MNVADHALARRNRPREFVADRMAGFLARNRRIVRCAVATVAEWRVLRGVRGRSIVRVDNVARRASTRPIVARLVVRAGQGEQWIEETRLLQPQKNGVGAKLRAKSARAQLVVGFPGIVRADRLANLALGAAAALKHAQHIPRLRNLPALDR